MIVCKNDFRKEQLFLFSASAVLAGAAAGALFLSRVCTTGAFLVLMLLLGASYLCVWSRKLRKLSHPVMLLTAAYVAECLMQLQIEHRFDLLWSYQRIIDYLLYLGFFAFFAAAARRKSGGIIFGHIFFFAVATLNLMVTVFRGKPIYFPDPLLCLNDKNIIESWKGNSNLLFGLSYDTGICCCGNRLPNGYI